ncbi:hypothetical protein [Nocardioides dilutus]
MYLCVHRDVHERKRVAMKKAVPFLIVLFVGYYVLQDPAGAAGQAGDAVGGLWGLTTQLFDALIDFFDAL